jgi:hypothetical protein
MIQMPNCVGLTLCEKVVVEETTHRLTLVNCFQSVEIEDLPWEMELFYRVFCLTDGIGEGKLFVRVSDMDTMDEFHEFWMSAAFDDPLAKKVFVVPVHGCTLQRSGRHEVALYADTTMIGRIAFEVELVED